MRLVRFMLLALVLAYASDAESAVTVELGAGINHSRDSNLILLGVVRDAGYLGRFPSYQAFNIGVWNGRYDASIAGVAQGINIGLGFALLQASLGAAYISETNDRLSTEFEFYEQLSLHKRLAGIEFAVSFRHWSNGGIRQPNGGMDFAGLVVSHRW